MSDLYELRCRECGKSWGNQPRSFCEDCFSPLEVAYDYDSLKKSVRRENLASRDFTMWRYSELLPLPDGYIGPNAVGGTPLVASRKLGRQWGIENLYFKNDAVCFPSLSFKDRVVATALAAARRFGFENRRLFLHRQSCQRGGRASRPARLRRLRLHSRGLEPRQSFKHRRVPAPASCASTEIMTT